MDLMQLFRSPDQVDILFLDFLKNHDKDLFVCLMSKRYHCTDYMSSELIQLAFYVEKFLLNLCQSDVHESWAVQAQSSKELFVFKRNFIHRFALIQYNKEFCVTVDFDLVEYQCKYYMSLYGFGCEDIADDIFMNYVNFLLDNNGVSSQLNEAVSNAALYAAYRVYFGNSTTLFSVASKLNFDNLSSNVYYEREINDCKSNAVAYDNAHYCLKCHTKSKDFCSKGFESGVVNKLGNELSGCPLRQKISESIELYSCGNILAALVIIMLDNPLVALTGYRICNDCSKSCIFQKQDAVDVPFIESEIYHQVLSIKYGVELYILLTQWMPLSPNHYLPKQNSGKRVFVAGQGPAGIAAAYYMLHHGHEVIAIDGQRIRKLDDAIITNCVTDLDQIKSLYNSFAPYGFGGVCEYGITKRWDKSNLLIVRMILERSSSYKLYGGVHFGTNVDKRYILEELECDHIILACGAGAPVIPEIRGMLGGNCRTASDFLMSVQSINEIDNATLVFLPAIVVGGGLTAVDCATELVDRYVYQISNLDKLLEKRFIKKEYIDIFKHHYNILINDGYEAFINYTSGVSIIYRGKKIESPAYRLNHEELNYAIHKGVKFIEEASILEAHLDADSNIYAVSLVGGIRMFVKSLIIATGTDIMFSDKSIEGKVSYIGDLDERYHGSVVKAIASAKDYSIKIDRLLSAGNNMQPALELDLYKSSVRTSVDVVYEEKELKTSGGAKTLSSSEVGLPSRPIDLASKLMSIKPLNDLDYELVIDSPTATKFVPGQFYKLQVSLRATLYNVTDLVRDSEPIAVTPFLNSKGQLVFILRDVGFSTNLIAQIFQQSLLPFYDAFLMGPLPSKFSLPNIYYASACMLLEHGRPNSVAIEKYASTLFCLYYIDTSCDFDVLLSKISIYDTIIVQFSINMLEKLLSKMDDELINKTYISSNTQMQCMMQGVCGRCAVMTKDKQVLFTCKEHYIKANLVDLDEIRARLSQ